MHGSLDMVKRNAAAGADVHSVEPSSGRTALHKSAFWGHQAVTELLLGTVPSLSLYLSLSFSLFVCPETNRY